MQKSKFHIVHAADLHLGAPFKGIAGGSSSCLLPPELKNTLVNATYAALEHLVDFCLRTKPHALLLAGDLYNPEGGGLKSLNALKSACQRLEAANIMVLMIHGNHDAASLQPSWTWPGNVHIFRADRAESIPLLMKDGVLSLGAPIDENFLQNEDDIGACLAIIHGISHLQEKVTDNLAILVNEQARKISPQLFAAWKIGLLHCAVGEKASEGERPYAPCSIDDLSKAPVDYWALGHVHKHSLVAAHPLAWYSGNSQGLHINETGPKGCLDIIFTPGLEPEVRFHKLASVEWHQLEYSIPPNMSLSSLQETLLASIKKIHTENSYPGLKGIILRLCLTGRTGLDGWLRGQNGELEAQVQIALSEFTPAVWLKDILIETRPALDLDKALNNTGLLGEALERIFSAQNAAIKSDEKIRDALLAGNNSPLGELYNSPAFRQAGIAHPENNELAALLEEAAWLCADLLNPQAGIQIQPDPDLSELNRSDEADR